MELLLQFVVAFIAAAITLGLLCRGLVNRMEREFERQQPPEVTENDGNRALIETLRTSIAERPNSWINTDTGIRHTSGIEIGATGREIWIEYKGRRSVVPSSLSFGLIRSVQIHNARGMLDAIATKEN